MSFWKSLFGGSSASAEKPGEPVDYNGFTIRAAPYKAEGQYQTAGSITKEIGGVLIAAKGQRVADYDEAPVAKHIKGRDIKIEVDVGVGTGKARVWTCDLTHRYIEINADYRS